MRHLIAILFSLLFAAPVWAVEGEVVSGFSVIESRARAGDAEAQLEVGILYEFGFYMQDNKVPALAWYILSAAQGNPQAANRRDLLKKELSAGQIAEAERLSETMKSGGKIENPTTMPKKEKMDKKPETGDDTKVDKKSSSQ
jgi:TPR repeat protein